MKPHGLTARESYSQKRGHNLASKSFLILVGVIIIAGLSFYGGIDYQKRHSLSSSSSDGSNLGSAGSNSAGFGRRFNSNRVFGQVTAISSTSISIQSRLSESVVTLGITSSTQITDSGQAVTTSDIQTGDTVMVTKSSSDGSLAATIVVNPSFGGFGGGSSQPGSSTPPGESSD